MIGAGRQTNLVVRRRTERIVPGSQPFQASQRQPSVRLLKFGGMLRAPCGEVALPRTLLPATRGRENATKKGKNSETKVSRPGKVAMHGGSIPRVPNRQGNPTVGRR